jgi:two-component system sensor histidine kinase PilS (NtrC family)
VIQDMPDGVLVVNESGRVRQYNPGVERLLGFTFSNNSNVTLENCAPQLADRFAVWRKHQRRKNEVLRLPITNHQVRVRFLPVEREGFWGAIIFLEDMQRVQAQAQQIKLAALGRLTANIAHEVRNPLSAISYATELLQEAKHDPAQTRLFQIIMDNTARLNSIVEDVLQLNRRDRVQREDYNLTEKLPLYIEGLRHTQGVSQEIFSIKVTSACVISFDLGHLDQVLWNLCRNALRYCNKQAGSVQLCAWCSNGGGTILEILNDGPPVAPETVQQLFEPFFTMTAGGTGLGLYIARELCEANGATLEYRQPATGGACFRIVFEDQNER